MVSAGVSRSVLSSSKMVSLLLSKFEISLVSHLVSEIKLTFLFTSKQTNTQTSKQTPH